MGMSGIRFDMNGVTILAGDCRETLRTLPDSSVHCCVTSPPEGPKLPDPQKTLPFDEWQSVPIENVIKITDKQLEKLHEGGIRTVIEFETERAGNRFSAIKGIGEKTVDAWEDQMVEWLAVNAREQEAADDVPSND